MTEQTQPGWYHDVRRWGQVNLREVDPAAADVGWWIDVFKRTRVDGIAVNAGGIFTYYPTAMPGNWKSRWLGQRDLFGEFVSAARAEGLHVLGRMDCAGVHRDFAYSHPDWLLVDKDGRPYQYSDVELYYTCPNSPYYREYFLDMFREILGSYDVDGLFDNGWPSLGRRQAMCHCVHCQRSFADRTGRRLPDEEDWDSEVYRAWVAWRYDVMAEVYELFNDVVRSVKPWAVWVGNLPGGDFSGAPNRGVDWLRMAEMPGPLEVDLQGRNLSQPLFLAGEFGRLLRSVAGDDPFFHLFGTWYAHTPRKRTLAKPAAELTLSMAQTAATGFRPWFHSIGATNEDRRWVPAVEEFYNWHADNDAYLFDRSSLADVGLVYSVQTLDYYGRDATDERVSEHLHGMAYALIRARIPFDFVHERRLDADSLARYRVLVLGNVAALSDAQCAQVRAFCERGGSVVATFETSLYDESGQPRGDYGLADVLGVHRSGLPVALTDEASAAGMGRPPLGHAFQLVRDFDHPVFAWVSDTDYLAYHGRLCPVTVDADVRTLATLIPPYSIYPPETTFALGRETSTPTVVTRQPGGSRVVYFPGDVDRELYRHNLWEFGRIIGEAVRWALGEPGRVRVDGPGVVDVQPYEKNGDVIVHLVNMHQAGLWRAPIDELAALPGQRLTVDMPEGRPAGSVRCLVSGGEPSWDAAGRTVTVQVPAFEAHEVVVVGSA